MARWGTKEKKRERRHLRLRRKMEGTTERPRLTIYRSLTQIYAQIVDDTTGKTLVAVSSLTKDLKPRVVQAKSKIERSKLVGLAIAERAKAAGVTQVCFDRAGFRYHGRVKAVADGAREGGLSF
ncbi:MAG TPA: 50S ribosomal protein L18 [Candidatus Eisenbacteria bacterium]|jgi:large subunit ribosomal protein L18|nr:50S ribosomal protein L18 [Candidatus Eisenbacteria bacterium]